VNQLNLLEVIREVLEYKDPYYSNIENSPNTQSTEDQQQQALLQNIKPIVDSEINIILEFIGAILVEVFSNIYFNTTKRKLLSELQEPITKEELLKKCNIPTTSGYRHLQDLESHGLIVPVRFEIIKTKKNILFTRLLTSVEMSIADGCDRIRAKISQEMLHHITSDIFKKKFEKKEKG